MDFKSMVERAKKTSVTLSPFEEIAFKSKRAVTVVDGDVRWFENGEIVVFENPRFTRSNAEFSIKDKPYQKIWFSQLSTRGMDSNLKAPLLDEIQFKGEGSCIIAERFTTPLYFWNAVKDKKFSVEIIGNGVSLNKDCPLVASLRRAYSAERNFGDVDTRVFDYIRLHVEDLKNDSLSKPLKSKKAYRLIEL